MKMNHRETCGVCHSDTHAHGACREKEAMTGKPFEFKQANPRNHGHTFTAHLRWSDWDRLDGVATTADVAAALIAAPEEQRHAVLELLPEFETDSENKLSAECHRLRKEAFAERKARKAAEEREGLEQEGRLQAVTRAEAAERRAEELSSELDLTVKRFAATEHVLRRKTHEQRTQLNRLEKAMLGERAAHHSAAKREREALRRAEDAERRLRYVLGLEESWPLADVLSNLSETARVLLQEKGHDGHGWEEIRHAAVAARELRKRALAAFPNSDPPSPTMAASEPPSEVSHEQAWGIIGHIDDKERWSLMNRYISQSEARDRRIAELEEQLTQAQSTANGAAESLAKEIHAKCDMRDERDALKAKVAELERVLQSRHAQRENVLAKASVLVVDRCAESSAGADRARRADAGLPVSELPAVASDSEGVVDVELLEHLLERERREHEETKGYRQHAEQEAQALKAKVAELEADSAALNTSVRIREDLLAELRAKVAELEKTERELRAEPLRLKMEKLEQLLAADAGARNLTRADIRAIIAEVAERAETLNRGGYTLPTLALLAEAAKEAKGG